MLHDVIPGRPFFRHRDYPGQFCHRCHRCLRWVPESGLGDECPGAPEVRRQVRLVVARLARAYGLPAPEAAAALAEGLQAVQEAPVVRVAVPPGFLAAVRRLAAD